MNAPSDLFSAAGALPALPPQPISTDVLAEKYLKDDESRLE